MASRSVGFNMLQSGRMEVSLFIEQKIVVANNYDQNS